MQIRHWRLADGPKADLVIARGRDQVDAIECKWNREHFDPAGLQSFRTFYPQDDNYLVYALLEAPGYATRAAGMEIYVCNPAEWLEKTRKPTP